MFKSSFAREIIEETKQNSNLDSVLSSVLVSDINSGYKSSFAASTHSALDNMPPEAGETRFSLRNINLQQDLATSDLGTSDFSSSELWPASDRQLEDMIAGFPTSNLTSKFDSRRRTERTKRTERTERMERDGFPDEERGENNQSFLNLQSQMPFSYLEQVPYIHTVQGRGIHRVY